jgi:hypothetical protein
MPHVLQLLFLLAGLNESAVLAQQAPVVTPTPGQVQPVPLVPTPLVSSATSTACLVACDTQVMTCQNACVIPGPATSTASSAGISPCTISCTTQQLVCKQGCSRISQ